MGNLPKVAIVGRPNVGKSSVFNRIVRRRIAIVHDEPGVTRDRHYADAEWNDRRFALIDTGGLDMNSDEKMVEMVRSQVNRAIDESDLLLFVVDVVSGVTPEDRMIADLLRQTEKPTVLAANKSDNPDRDLDALEFFELALGEPIPISAIHDRGIADLLDEVIAHLPGESPVEEAETGIKIAVVGRPNAGKSSLINAILGEDRVIVDSEPGTTRDSISVVFHRDQDRFTFIDTAGMRRRTKVEQGIEQYSISRALRSIAECDIAWLVVDYEQGLVHQDKTIAKQIFDKGKGCMIVVNKWDIAQKEERDPAEYTDIIRTTFPKMSYAPILFTSAKTGLHIDRLLDMTVDIYRNFTTMLPTHALNDLLRQMIVRRSHPTVGNRKPSLKFISQVGVAPPAFLIFTTFPKLIREDYQQYLINGIRRAFGGFEGVPLRIIYRDSRENERRGS